MADLPTSPETILDTDYKTKFDFSTFAELEKALKAKGFKPKATFPNFEVTESFRPISLTEQDIAAKVMKLNQAETIFEQQALLRNITLNKLKDEFESITFKDAGELQKALEQRGLDYPTEYLHQGTSNYTEGFKVPRTLTTKQWTDLVAELKGITKDGLQKQKQGEIIKGVFVGKPEGATQRADRELRGATTLSGAESGGEKADTQPGQKILVNVPYPNRETAIKKAVEGADKFPISVNYSKGENSYSIQITTKGNIISVGGKEFAMSFGNTPITSIDIQTVDNTKVVAFVGSDGKVLAKMPPSVFGDEAMVHLLNAKSSGQVFPSERNPNGVLNFSLSGDLKGIQIPTPTKELSDAEADEHMYKEAEKYINTIVSKESLSVQSLDDNIRDIIGALDFKWLGNIPGMNEESIKLRKLDVTLRGFFGDALIRRLETSGYNIQFVAKNKITIQPKMGDSAEIEAKINAYLANSPDFMHMLQAGMLYRQPSFDKYRASVTSDGKIINPAKTDITTYVDYLRKKSPNELTKDEQVFLSSHTFFDKGVNFHDTLLQSADFRKVMVSIGRFSGQSGGTADIVDAMRSDGTRGTPPQRANAPAGAAGSPEASAAINGAGGLIGKAGGILGSVAEAGIGGGANALGEIFKSAEKTGGGYDTLAVIALIGYSIFGKKGLGFWGTLGAIFGIGVFDSITKGKLKGLIGGNTATAPAPAANSPTGTADLAAAAAAQPTGAPRGTPGDRDKPAERVGNEPFTELRLLADALRMEAGTDTQVLGNEMKYISHFKKMNFKKLNAALVETDEKLRVGLWNEAIKSAGLSSIEQNALMPLLNDGASKGILAKLTAYLNINPHITKLDGDKKDGNTLGEMIDHVINQETNGGGAPNAAPVGAPAEAAAAAVSASALPTDLIAQGDGHSHLYMLARLLTHGYIPQLSTTTFESIRNSDAAWYKKVWGGMMYSPSMAFLTNNDPQKSVMAGSIHNWLADKTNHAFVLKVVADEKNMVAEALAEMKGKSIDGKAIIETELLDRKSKVDALESILGKQPIDEKALKSAIAAYEASVKTKWEIIGNKIGTKIGANGWKIFSKVDMEVYVNKGESIIKGSPTRITEADIEKYIREKTPIEIDGGKFMITSISNGETHYSLIHPNGSLGPDRVMKVEDCIAGLNKHLEVGKITAEAIRLGEEIDTKKQAVFEKFTAWEAVPKNEALKTSAMAALEDYNKTVMSSCEKLGDKFSLLTESEAKALLKSTKQGGWLSNLLEVNISGKNFDAVDKIGAWADGHGSTRFAKKGFVGVGIFSLVYTSGNGVLDNIKAGNFGTAMMSVLDLGIGVIPYVGAGHDVLILNSKTYERFMLGRDMSEDERNMRAYMVGLGMIPGLGMAVKFTGKVAQSEKLLVAGSAIVKSGHLAGITTTYAMLGLGITQTTFDIAKKIA